MATGLILGWAVVGASQDGSAAAPSADEWLKQRQAEFAEYRFSRDLAGKPAELKFQSRSLLNWSNPERGSGTGGLFLWTADGRPQMISCAFEYQGSVKHEFHSLSSEAIDARRGDKDVHRFGPGLEWHDLADVPAPAGQRPLRLAQMRRQAARFSVAVGLNKGWSETRLLPQPLYRTPADVEGDLGLFVFVQGTDPECVLLLEATAEKTWRYSLTRQSKWKLRAQLDEKEVWQVDPSPRPGAEPRSPFLVLSQPPAEEPAAATESGTAKP
jgi:hypothetical protein